MKTPKEFMQNYRGDALLSVDQVIALMNDYVIQEMEFPRANSIPRYPDPPPPPRPTTDTSHLPGIDPTKVIPSSPQMVKEGGGDFTWLICLQLAVIIIILISKL
jgi:hypothetical protein